MILSLYYYIIVLLVTCSSLLAQELKEIQNRLVTSACESFVAAKLKDPTLVPSNASSATPHSLSPASTRPSSTVSGKLDQDLDELVGQVSLRAHIIAQAHKNRLASQPQTSRSFADLSELREASGEATNHRARLLQSKYSSELGLHSSSKELERSTNQVMKRIDALIQESRRVRSGSGQTKGSAVSGRGQETEDQWEEFEMDITLSDPSLAQDGEGKENATGNGEITSNLLADMGLTCLLFSDKFTSPVRRPFSSAAVLQSHAPSRPLNRIRSSSRASEASTG